MARRVARSTFAPTSSAASSHLMATTTSSTSCAPACPPRAPRAWRPRNERSHAEGAKAGCLEKSKSQAPALAAFHTPRRCAAEMAGEEDRIGVCILLEQTPTGRDRLSGILIRKECRLRIHHLDRMVEAVPGKNRTTAAALCDDAEIPR